MLHDTKPLLSVMILENICNPILSKLMKMLTHSSQYRNLKQGYPKARATNLYALIDKYAQI